MRQQVPFNVFGQRSDVAGDMKPLHAPRHSEPALLVVDDSPDLVLILSKTLERRGYKVFTALSADRAAEILTHNAIDLAIIDGDLGDKNYGRDGRSGSLISEFLQGHIRFVRFSGRSDLIPRELAGERCFTKGGSSEELEGWLLANLPPGPVTAKD